MNVSSREFCDQVSAAYEASDGAVEVSGLGLRRAVIECARLHCIRFENCLFEDVVFIDCDLRGADFRSSNPARVILFRCKIRGIEIRKDDSVISIDCDDESPYDSSQ